MNPISVPLETESIVLPNGTLVVATAKNCWLSSGQTFSTEKTASGLLPATSQDSLRQLLAGCILAGLGSSKRAQPKPRRPKTLPSYLYALCSGYRTAAATPPAMRLAAATFREQGLLALAAHAAEVAREETGHDLMVLRDMNALGIDGKRFVERVQPAFSLAVVDHLQALASSPHPVGVFGYAYTLERLCALIGQRDIDQIEALIPPGLNAMRFVRLHSGIGAEAHHVEEGLGLMVTLGAADRATAALAAYSTACMFGAAQEPPSDREVLAIARDCATEPDLISPWLCSVSADLAEV